MEFLGLIYGIASVLVLLLVLSTVRSAVEYRAVGISRSKTLRGAVVILCLTVCWSAAAIGLLIFAPWSHAAPFSVAGEHLILAVLPVVIGWVPGVLLLGIGASHTDGTLKSVPRWARWMDALWMA